MGGARFARRFGGPVGATVVDDQGLDGVDAFDLLRDVAQGLRDRCFLVVRGDLDNELQLKVSVVMPVERLGGDAERAIASVLAQLKSPSFRR